MRIQGDGAGSGGGSHGGGDRPGAFRRRHRPGERLAGRVLRREAPGLAWVDIQGLELLASIASDPAPGTVLLFEVLRTDPDILLRELHVARAANDPLGPAADAFWAARSRFEAHAGALREAMAAAGADPAARQAAFARALAADPGLDALFQTLEQARAAASALTAARGAGSLEYRPWLLPWALSGEMLVAARPAAAGAAALVETTFAFAVPGPGQCELRLLESPPRASARLLAEHPDRARDVLRAMQDAGWPGPGARLFAPAPLPAAARAGVLAPLLCAASLARPRLSRRV
ncbi:hypothetical protein [Desulfocurvus vexinensis]|uniref:hypothetical protein n=1 Tax=Desulfocurvus vexinensis TaxID=399548 RepID=UPI00048D3555|nr:hypothetical protein [Desulfocurvus vexinensis]